MNFTVILGTVSRIATAKAASSHADFMIFHGIISFFACWYCRDVAQIESIVREMT